MKKKQLLIFCIMLALIIVGCKVVTNLFSPEKSNEPIGNQPVQNIQPEPNNDETEGNFPSEPEAPIEEPEYDSPQNSPEPEAPIEMPEYDSPQDSPEPNLEGLTLLNEKGIELYYDPELIGTINVEWIPASPDNLMGAPYPPYMEYYLPAENAYIDLVDAFFLMNAYEYSAEDLVALQVLIDDQDPAESNCIPTIPLKNITRDCGHQQFNTQVKRIEFRNGVGIRFITVYVIHDYVAVSNETLEYEFVGITSDGSCFLRATFPISHEELPEKGEVPDNVWQDMTGIAGREYFDSFVTIMEANPEGFSPSLDELDQIIESLATGNCGRG